MNELQTHKHIFLATVELRLCRRATRLVVSTYGNVIIGVGTVGAGGLGPLTFLFDGAQYDRGPLTFEKCRPIFELKVTPYFQS